MSPPGPSTSHNPALSAPTCPKSAGRWAVTHMMTAPAKAMLSSALVLTQPRPLALRAEPTFPCWPTTHTSREGPVGVLRTWQDPPPKTQPSSGGATHPSPGVQRERAVGTSTISHQPWPQPRPEQPASGASREKGILPQKPPGKALGTLLPEATSMRALESGLQDCRGPKSIHERTAHTLRLSVQQLGCETSLTLIP